jgi:hypothetical protein
LPEDYLWIEGIDNSSLREIELQLSYLDEDDITVIDYDTIKCTVIDVDFFENSGQTYGFDEFTNRYNDRYKSVKVGDEDIFECYSSIPSSVYFESGDTDIATIDLSQPTTSPDTIHVTGVSEANTTIVAVLNSTEGSWPIADYLHIYSYIEDYYNNVVFCVVHEAGGYTSTTPYTASQLQTALNNNYFYNQAVVNWSVTQLPDMTVNFDLNNDGHWNSSTWGNSEMNAIANYFASLYNPDDYDQIIFIVDNPSTGCRGMADMNQKFSFIDGDITIPFTVTAHEIGHAAFGLIDLYNTVPPSSDTGNLMHDHSGSRLRVDQWETIQAKQLHE